MIAAQPSRTALRVALRRAAHQLVDTPLVFPDPFAIPILGRESTEELRRTPPASRRPFSASLRAWVVTRARFAEEVLAEAVLETGIRQYLVLGAGLDTFALRNPYPGLRVFEVDHPATQAWKRERLHAANLKIPANAHLVPVDFETQSLPLQLEAAGFDASQPCCTAWLGVVPYLTHEAFATTCLFLGSLPNGSGVVFDYGQPREVLPPVEQLMHDSLSARVAQAGEPFQLFFTPETVRTTLSPHGLITVQDFGGSEINALYLAHRSDNLRVHGTSGRLCHAQAESLSARRHV